MADAADLLAEAVWLRRLARGLVGDGAADDVVQETLARAIDAPPDPDRPPRPWLARVMRNVTRMQFRSASRRTRREEAVAEPPVDSTSPAAIVERLEAQRALTELVLALDEPFRKTIVRHYFDGRTFAEIAREDGIPDGTVRWRHKQALERLRAQLDARANGDRRAWVATLAPIATAGGLVMKKVIIAAIVVVAAGALWSTSRTPAPAASQPAAAPEVATPAGAAAPPRHVTKLASTVERRAIADRIASAHSVRHVPAGPAPSLPQDDMEELRTSLRDAMREVIPYLTDCYAQARPQLAGPQTRVQAHLTLTGDKDIGTLIDAPSVVDDAGTPLPQPFEECLRATFQTLELPSLAEGDTIDVTYPFLFADEAPT